MEKLEELEEVSSKKCIGIGNVYFTRLDKVSCWDTEFDASDGATYITCHCPPLYKKDATLIAVKYLGNSIVQEMVTGEKMFLNDSQFDLGDLEKNNMDILTGFPLKYADFVNLGQGRAMEYMNLMKKFKEAAMNYPLTLNAYEEMYEVDENSKKEYLKGNNEHRKQVIEAAKNRGIANGKKIIGTFLEELTAAENSIKAEENMAYLENDLYNFSGGKVK